MPSISASQSYGGLNIPALQVTLMLWKKTRTELAAERERLPCGHHKSLMLHSAETGQPLYCELCDAKSGRRDAERMEAELRTVRDTLRAELAALHIENHALKAEREKLLGCRDELREINYEHTF